MTKEEVQYFKLHLFFKTHPTQLGANLLDFVLKIVAG